ncbi:hypothetical protein N1028_00395 [Herbiconiux sp. CPCC 203407]|uniref:Uncharacterized protein n=1 Tax=Herbiconiux oxytropis TaxID=2970915 RepID=A0AA41XDV0_9MICO|nr:hypothetical protein [Herbiconiux oxytropis]MCS5720872.1 hypothetical protein [Herbiconiux oxytropis]MCS5724349.1 hypothetical protein [Herbiconiux oxytropis]
MMIQLGTRWLVGDEPPSKLPQAVIDAIYEVEGELAEQGVDASDWSWTLTWLEGRPVVELDDETVVEYDAANDAAVVTPGS